MNKMILILLLLFNYGYANNKTNSKTQPKTQSVKKTNVVSNKTGIKIETNQGFITSEDMKGKFTLLWFYDTNCPHCENSMKSMKNVVDWINNNYSNEINVIFVSVVPRDFESLDNFLEQNELLDHVYSGRVPNPSMNSYMNVEATPTMILVDPYLTIVDKIEGIVIPGVYTRHIAYIMSKFENLNN